MCLLIIVSKETLQQGIPGEYHLAGACARSRLEEMCDKLQSGEVNIEDLQKLSNNQEQMQRLCVAVSSSKDGRYSYKLVEAAVKKRLEEHRAVKRRREVISHLYRQLHPVADNLQGMSLSSCIFHPSIHPLL